ncbi:hypothetical protein YC2023_034299 [Brassica napus]
MATVNVSWCLNAFILFTYTTCGGCPLTWIGFSIEAFTGLWEFAKLSASSGIMIWYSSLRPLVSHLSFGSQLEHNFLEHRDSLEYWYYRILIMMAGNLEDSKIAVDSVSISMSIYGLELMIPIAFLAVTGVRVANELGAGNGRGARFAMIISVTQSLTIGIIFSVLVVFLHDQIGWMKPL